MTLPGKIRKSVESEISQGIAFTIPLTPPSLNAAVRHTRRGGHYVSSEAVKFKEAVAVYAKGRSVQAKEYKIHITIYFGKGQRGDVDNLGKVAIDGLVDCECIHSDAAVRKLILEKHRDNVNPRTEVSIEPF